MTAELQALAVPVMLGIVMLYFAGTVHRSVEDHAALVHRRRFYAMVGHGLLIVAFALAIACVGLWADYPLVVLMTTAGWIGLCTSVLLTLWLLGRCHHGPYERDKPQRREAQDGRSVPRQSRSRQSGSSAAPAPVPSGAAARPAWQTRRVSAGRNASPCRLQRPRVSKRVFRANLAVYRRLGTRS